MSKSPRARISEPTNELRMQMNEALLISSVRQHELAEQAEKASVALHASEERSRALLEAAPLGVYVCDPDGAILQYNRQATEIWGRAPIIGVEKYTGSTRLWLPNGTLLAPEESPVAVILRTGETVRNVELAIERADGSRLPVILSCDALWSPDRRISGAIASFVDLSDRKAAEEALALSEARFRLMAEVMPQKVFTTTQKGEITYLNPQWMEYTGVPFEQMTDGGDLLVVHPDDLLETRRRWEHSLASGEPLLIEQRLLRSDGAYRWHISRALPMRDADGHVIQWVGSCTDVDDVVRAEEAMRIRLEGEVNLRTAELMETNQQLRGFTYSVAHDLRQHIRGISINASILLREGEGTLSSDTLPVLNRLVNNSKSLSKLVDDLLNHARLGKQAPSRQHIDMSALADSVAKQMNDLATCRRRTTFKIARDLTAVGDAAMIRLVIENLFDNACKYAAEGTDPVIELGQIGETFFVRDNGIGFDMRYERKMFEPFERLHPSSAYSGNGIGLANVKRIVEKHGGTVRAEGVLGEGTTIYFSLAAPSDPAV